MLNHPRSCDSFFVPCLLQPHCQAMTKAVRSCITTQHSTVQSFLTGAQRPIAASVSSESTADGPAAAFTPQSDSSRNFSFESAEASPSRFQGRIESVVPMTSSADRVIPSIEMNSDSSVDHNYTPVTTTPSTTRTSRNTSPVVDVKGKGILREGHGTDNIDARLQTLLMSSPGSGLDMSDMAAAIEGEASGTYNRDSLEPIHQGTEATSSTRPISRKRSSSRVPMTPYVVRDEEAPQDRFHEPAFQQAFADAKGLISELESVLGSSRIIVDPDSTMQRLLREARELAQFQCPSSRTVGFVGDSGVGTLHHQSP